MGSALALAVAMGVPGALAAQLLTYFVTGMKSGIAEREDGGPGQVRADG